MPEKKKENLLYLYTHTKLYLVTLNLRERNIIPILTPAKNNNYKNNDK